MAVTRTDLGIVFGAAADAVTDTVFIQQISFDHSAAANFVLQNTASEPVATGRIGAAGSLFQSFEPPIKCIGLKASTLSAGVLIVTLA